MKGARQHISLPNQDRFPIYGEKDLHILPGLTESRGADEYTAHSHQIRVPAGVARSCKRIHLGPVGISDRNQVQKLIRQGSIKARKVKGETRVSVGSVEDYLMTLEDTE